MDCQTVGNGETALKYLAPYALRVTISNNRIEQLENDAVTYRDQGMATDTSGVLGVTARMLHAATGAFLSIYAPIVSPHLVCYTALGTFKVGGAAVDTYFDIRNACSNSRPLLDTASFNRDYAADAS